MVNDTNTLNGALRELGETMAENLTTQGVPSTYDEGLTTLAGKILDIHGGGGTVADITLTSDKDVLSAYDHDVAELTVTLIDEDEEVVEITGATVIFTIYESDMETVVDTMTETTTNGVATADYSATGIGDIIVKAECMSLIQTYSISDYWYYDSQTVNKNRYTVSTGSASLTYGSNGLTVTGTAINTSTECMVLNNTITLPTNYIAEFTITDYNYTGTLLNKMYGGVIIDNILIDFATDVGTAIYSAPNYTVLDTFPLISKGDTIKVEMNNGSMKFYINDVLKGTYSISRSGTVRFRTFRYRTLVMKDLKILEL